MVATFGFSSFGPQAGRAVKPALHDSLRQAAAFASAYALVAIVAVAIIYGSLYPFAFQACRLPGRRYFCILPATWTAAPQSRGDMLANLLLYMPLGLTVCWPWADSTLRIRASVLTVAGGRFCPWRSSWRNSMTPAGSALCSDVYLNVLGTLAGLLIAWLAARPAASDGLAGGQRARLLRAFAAGLAGMAAVSLCAHHRHAQILAGACSRCFWRPAPRRMDVFRYTALWLSVSFLLSDRHCGRKSSLLLFLAALGFFRRQDSDHRSGPYPAGVAGRGIAAARSFLLPGGFPPDRFGVPVSRRLLLLSWLLTAAAALAIRRDAQSVSVDSLFRLPAWLPAGRRHLLCAEILSLRCVACCLLVRAGMRPGLAVALECIILLATSMLQTFMVGRSGGNHRCDAGADAWPDLCAFATSIPDERRPHPRPEPGGADRARLLPADAFGGRAPHGAVLALP